MFKSKVPKKYVEGPIYSVFKFQYGIDCLFRYYNNNKYGWSQRIKKESYSKYIIQFNPQVIFPKPKGNIELKHPIQQLDMGEEVIERMKYCAKNQIIVSNSQDYCVLFKFQFGKLELFHRFKTDYAMKNPCQYDGTFNYEGDTLATGGEEGVIRLWQVNNDVKMLWEFKEDPSKVNSLDFHIHFKLLIAACENFECKIINYEKQQLIKKLTITDKNVFNLKFAVAYFSQDEQNIFTIGNPNQGASYLTVWRMQDNNVTPIITKKICDSPVTASCVSAEGMFMGIGGFDGTTKIINLRYYDFEAKSFDNDNLSVKSVCFARDSRFLISSSSDLSYNFMANIRPEGWFSKATKVWVLLMFIIYITHGILGSFY